MTIYANMIISVLISFVKENFSGVNPIHAIIILFILIIFELFIVFLLDKKEKIFNELESAIHNKDNEKIMKWIEKYKGIPFFLSTAEKKYKSTSFFNISLHQELQKELPQKTQKIKRTKI
jgi:hypothetical protein